MAIDNLQQPENNSVQDMQPLQDDLIKHQMMIQRLQNSQTQNIKDYLNQLKRTALQQIRTGSTIDLNHKLRDSVKGLSKSAMESMGDLAEYESQFSAKLFNKHLDTNIQPVDRDKLVKTLNTKNMDIGHNYKSGTNELENTGTRRSLATAYTQFSNRKADEIANIIQTGYRGKLSDVDIGRKVSDKIDKLHMAQARSLAKTSVNYSTNLARIETIKNDTSGTISNDKYMWDATLENSCDDCESNNGQVFDIGGDVPPLHFNCACHVEPVSVTAQLNGMKAPSEITTNNMYNASLDLVNGADDTGG